jgi:hypothetical protein
MPRTPSAVWTVSAVKARARAALAARYWPSVAAALLAAVAAGGLPFGFKADIFSIQHASDIFVHVHVHPLCFFFMPDTFAALFLALGLLRALLLNPLLAGCARWFLANAEGTARPGDFAAPFRDWKRVAGTMALRDAWIFLCSLPAVFVPPVGFVLACKFTESLGCQALHLLYWLLAAALAVPAIVQLYACRLVPWLLATEPALSGRAVLARSRALMAGHKGKAFLLDLSFAGWFCIGFLTWGLFAVFHVCPYQQCANAELQRILSAQA